MNIARVGVLMKLGVMHVWGIQAFESRDPEKTNRYSFERADATLNAAQEKQFRANKKAWAFWEKQPPSYRKVAAWFVVSARKDETQARRLERLIADSAEGLRLDSMTKVKRAT